MDDGCQESVKNCLNLFQGIFKYIQLLPDLTSYKALWAPLTRNRHP
jgi:hypothetical protein